MQNKKKLYPSIREVYKRSFTEHDNTGYSNERGNELEYSLKLNFNTIKS